MDIDGPKDKKGPVLNHVTSLHLRNQDIRKTEIGNDVDNILKRPHF